MKLLVIVDMQKDFVDGALGTPEAAAIVPAVVDRVARAVQEGWDIIFTQDTHSEAYMDTQEGRNLPVPHCIRGSEGWTIIPQLQDFAAGHTCVEKPTFGSLALAELVSRCGYESIELIGLCTDICVISNAMLLKAALPEVPIFVDSACCAGVTPASHANALEAMKLCQITIK